MKDFKGKISVIMPAFNEGKVIYNNILETKRVFDGIGCNYEILVIDDGSKDNTYQEVFRAAEEYPNILALRYDNNTGKGHALIHGFNNSSGNLVIFLDADLDLHPIGIQRLYSIMKDKSADVVIGSKRHKDSVIYYPKRRKIMSWVYFTMVDILFGLPLTDTQTGLKLFKREALEKTCHKLLCKRFAFDLELLVNIDNLGYKICEGPILLDFRRENKFGNIRPKDIYKIAMDTFAIFYRLKILKYYDRIK